MLNQIVRNNCAVNCALRNIGFFLCSLAVKSIVKTVQRSAGNTTPNLTKHLR